MDFLSIEPEKQKRHEKSLRTPVASPPKNRPTHPVPLLQRDQPGLDPHKVQDQWSAFARKNNHLCVGERNFADDIDLRTRTREEAKSLRDFLKSIGRFHPEGSQRVILETPGHYVGSEHKVFLDPEAKRVTKLTHPGKFGEWDATPSQYLERLCLTNKLLPELDYRIEGCMQTDLGNLSIVTSMAYFPGENPTQKEVEIFLDHLGFIPLETGSETIDFEHVASNLIIRDCKLENWIKNTDILIPIDIIPQYSHIPKD